MEGEWLDIVGLMVLYKIIRSSKITEHAAKTPKITIELPYHIGIKEQQNLFSK